MTTACADLLAEIDEALSRLAADQRRVTDSEAWHRYVDRLLDERLLLWAAFQGSPATETRPGAENAAACSQHVPPRPP